MAKSPNPFYELYVGEQLKADEFATVFSPFLLSHVDMVFRHGNVVVQGVKGAGKSMLLGLLKTDVRLAYSNAIHNPYPVPENARNFLTTSINLAQSGATSFGLRPIAVDGADPGSSLPLFFGDFANYWLVRDLFKSLTTHLHIKEDGSPQVNLGVGPLREFCSALIAGDVWSGYLKGCEPTLESIDSRIRERLTSYREYLNYNAKQLNTEIVRTKTQVGEPLALAFDCLVDAGVLSDKTSLIVIIDQYEELADIDANYESDGRLYRRVINSALKRRDPRLSYRIGTRGYAWQTEVEIHGSTGVLEDERDYKLVDLDSMLRKPENQTHTWIFPDFAGEVLRRRLEFSGLSVDRNPSSPKTSISQVFGRSLSWKEKGKKIAGKKPWKAVKVAEGWPKIWKSFLHELADEDPLQARLAESWIRQQLAKTDQSWRRLDPNSFSTRPWSKTYWEKERKEQAILQIATRCQQRIKWSGDKDLVGLSGGNILIFLALCQHIWEFKIKSSRSRPELESFPISSDLQAIGIYEASERWVDRIVQATGRSYERHRFIEFLGDQFRKWLSEDINQSYPGHNGFSVFEHELDADADVKVFLEECSDYGNLVSLPHTTKSKDKRLRRKFYLAQIYSPKFRISMVRNKEPKYVRVADVRQWMSDLGILPKPQQTFSFD